jgi:hypothetical protein
MDLYYLQGKYLQGLMKDMGKPFWNCFLEPCFAGEACHEGWLTECSLQLPQLASCAHTHTHTHTHIYIFLGTWNLADSWGKHNHMEVLADKGRIKEFVLFLTAGRNFLQTWDQTEGGRRRWSNKCVYKGCVAGALGTKPPLDDCVSSGILLSCPHFARLQHVFFVIHGSLIHNDMELQQYNFLDTKLQAPRTLPPLLLFWGLLSSQSRALISLAFWKSFFSYLFS